MKTTIFTNFILGVIEQSEDSYLGRVFIQNKIRNYIKLKFDFSQFDFRIFSSSNHFFF